MTLEMDITVEVKDIRGEFMLQTLICNGTTPRFTLTIEQAETLMFKLQAQIENAQMARRNRKREHDEAQ